MAQVCPGQLDRKIGDGVTGPTGYPKIGFCVGTHSATIEQDSLKLYSLDKDNLIKLIWPDGVALCLYKQWEILNQNDAKSTGQIFGDSKNIKHEFLDFFTN